MAKTMEGKKSGWYIDPDQNDTLRYWDGDGWTDRVMPTERKGTSILKLAGGVALGNIVAATVLWVGYGLVGPGSAADCISQNFERAQNGTALVECE